MTGVTRSWTIAYQSRSGAAYQPWLEPDVNDRLRELAEGGTRAVVTVPIGFTADHMEVVHDLDVEAADTAATLGLAFTRATTPGTDPEFVAMAAELVRERLDPTLARRSCTGLGPAHDECPLTCCPSLRPVA
jgi:ferrochelatase